MKNLCSSLLMLMLFLPCSMSDTYAEQTNVNKPMNSVLGDDVNAEFLSQLSPGVRKLLVREIFSPAFEGVVSAGLVNDMLNLKQGAPDSIQHLMLLLLPLASEYALPPISNFRVGAIAQGESGALYLGANLEIDKSALGFAVHAEQSAINNAVLHGEKSIKRIAVTAAPCGHCRQFMNELDAASELEIIVRGEDPISLTHLLPGSFSPLDLGLEHGLLATTTVAKQCHVHKDDVLACHGVEAIAYSYAPHSASPATITIRTDNVMTVGAYIENVAYNPSLPPLQSALDRLRFKQKGIANIKEVVLVQMAGAKINQSNYTKAVLAEIAVDALFRVITIDNKKTK